MNPELIVKISSFLSKYYIWEIVIMVLVLGLTMVLKLPIKKGAIKLQEKYGVDKSALTWVIAFIPYALTLLMVFVLYWYKSKWSLKFDSIQWASMFTETGIIASGAIGIYEAVKKLIEGSKAISEKKKEKKAIATTVEKKSYRVKK